MSLTVQVEPLARTLEAAAGANLLETLQANEIPVSYSCMAGRCGTCRCKVVQGSVLESGREFKLTGLDDGRYVLACMSVLTESCTIEIPEPDEIVTHPARIIKAKVSDVSMLTHDICRVRMQLAKPLSFSAGQYVRLQFTPDMIRPYSMAGLSDDGEMEFHVRVVPGGRVSNYIASELKVGDAVRVSGPLGTAYLRSRHEGPMLCIAGGTGLAPVLSIVRGALAQGMDNPIHIYFGVRSPADVYYEQELNALAAEHPQIKVQVVVTTGAQGAERRQGLVTDAVAEDWGDLEGFRAYVCGAPPMVEAAALLLTSKGIPAERVYADAFYAAAD